MNWYMTTLTKHGRVIESGWMLAQTDRELIDYAHAMGYGIDIRFIGPANMHAVLPEVIK